MNKISKYFLYVCILGVLLSLNSCQDKWDAPAFEAPKYTGPAANKTIRDIIDVYINGGQMDSICHAGETFVVKATVVSSDEGGNFYKLLVVQDETGAIQIPINKTGLYNFYPVGQTVYINCSGLVVGNYRGVYQIGWIYEGSVGRIDAQFIDQYIHKDGLPMEDISSLITDINSPADLTEANVSRLVRIKNCEFTAAAQGEVWASSDYITNREIAKINDLAVPTSTLYVRTSNYADFINYRVPQGKGDLIGILSIYNSTYQFMLRTKDDVGSFGVLEDVYPMTISANSWSEGWQVCGTDEYPDQNWQIANFSNFKFMSHPGMISLCDDWLVTPEIPIDIVAGSSMYIEHFNDITSSSVDSYKVYYCTNFNGTIHEEDWHELTITNYPSEFGLSNAIAIEGIQSNFRLAFRYRNTGGTTSQWGIKSIKFNKLVQS